MNEEIKQIKGKKSKFKKGLLIYTAALLAAVGIGLIVFWNFLAAYDDSLAETAIDAYLSSMTKDEWRSMIASNAVYDTNAFESADALYEKSASAIADAEISYVKNYQSYSDEAPAYYLIRDGKKFAEITLKPGDDVGFGFTAFTVDLCRMIEEVIAAEPFSVMVLAPKGAEVKLNGIALDETYITEADMESRRISKYSVGNEARPKCTVYTVDGFYDMPTAEALLADELLQAEVRGALFVFDYPESVFHTLTVTAPSNAVVRLNGIKLQEEPVSQVVLGSNPYEETLAEHVTMNTYVINGLFEKTTAECFLNGKAIAAEDKDGELCFAYPQELIYHTRIMAPTGANITVNGMPISPDSEKITDVYDGFDERTIAKWLDGYPMCDVYEIGELYFAPDVKATLDGVALDVSSSTTPSDYTVVVGYPTDTNVPAEIAYAAEDFTRTFLYYMARGYYEFDKNILLAQSKALRESDAFRSVRESGYGVYFNSCYDLTSNEATAVSITHYTDHCVSVAVEYALDKVRYSRTTHEEGCYELMLVYVEGAWSVAEFTTVVNP